jgi:F-box-like
MDSVEMELHTGKQLPSISHVTLPPELLRMIFIACANPPFTVQHPSYWCNARNMQWIAITHVCRYWRSVALGYSDLWKRLYFFNPDVTKEMILRSQGANLEVIIDADLRSIAKSTFVPMVLPELHRVSILRLSDLFQVQSLGDGLVSAAPKLEDLYLSASYGAFYIPDTIFSRGTPALRSLELHKCTFTSPSPSSGTLSSPYSRIGRIPSTISQIVSFLRGAPMLALRSLKLHKCIFTSPSPSSGTVSSPDSRIRHIPSTISQIVSSLRGAPMLHTLKFVRVLPFVGTEDAYPNLVLPKLSRLELSSSIASCTNFLEHVIFPVTTDTTVTCENSSQVDNYGRLFRTFFSVMGNRKTNSVISALTLKAMFEHGYYTVSIRCTISHSHQPAPTNVTFKFPTNFHNHELDRNIFNIAIVTLPLTNAHELKIAGGGPWRVISFNSLPNIHTIRFKTFDLPLSIVRAALADNEHSHQLRSLRNLQFSNMTFLDEGIFTLMDGLKRRLLSGFPIEYIRFDACYHLKQADVMRMKEFVQDVEWDGAKY